MSELVPMTILWVWDQPFCGVLKVDYEDHLLYLHQHDKSTFPDWEKDWIALDLSSWQLDAVPSGMSATINDPFQPHPSASSHRAWVVRRYN
jgi:hypothetical protein